MGHYGGIFSIKIPSAHLGLCQLDKNQPAQLTFSQHDTQTYHFLIHNISFFAHPQYFILILISQYKIYVTLKVPVFKTSKISFKVQIALKMQSL